MIGKTTELEELNLMDGFLEIFLRFNCKIGSKRMGITAFLLKKIKMA